jgi:hypothetical protein
MVLSELLASTGLSALAPLAPQLGRSATDRSAVRRSLADETIPLSFCSIATSATQ